MTRDYRKLRVFETAHDLVREVYKLVFPSEERFGIQSQIRRAAMSTSTNIVEGSARKTDKDYVHFLYISIASATETRYLLGLASDLQMVPADTVTPLVERYGEVIRSLDKLIRTIEGEA